MRYVTVELSLFNSASKLLNFSRTKLQMLLRCCLISIFILRHFYIYYIYLCLDLGLFMCYLCDLYFVFIFVLIMINHIISQKQTHLTFFRHFLEYVLLFLDHHIDEEWEYFSNSKNSASVCCLAFAWFFTNFNLVLLIKVLLIKKAPCIFMFLFLSSNLLLR